MEADKGEKDEARHSEGGSKSEAIPSYRPEPFDDLISDARDDGSVQSSKETPEGNTSTDD